MQDEPFTQKVKEFVQRLGAFKVGIANPDKGFYMARDGCHPHDIMSDCKSVIVFALNVGLDYYQDLHYAGRSIRLGHLYRDWATLDLVNYLRKNGHDARAAPRELEDEANLVAPLSLKLAAYEAGLGVFGRPSMIITPEFGPRVNLAAVLTDAVLDPDARMTDFKPCPKCTVCAGMCPVNAIRTDRVPPTGFDRQKCVSFIDWTKKTTKEKIRLCGVCYNNCPAGKQVTKTVHIGKWKTLDDLNYKNRKTITDNFHRSIER